MPRFNSWFPTSLWGGGAVNVASSDFGTFDGTGTVDMLPNLQAADAYRVAQGKQVLVIPSGANLKISNTFVPGGGSFTIVSDGGVGNSSNYGAKITASFNDAPAISCGNSGTGLRRMLIRGLRITSSVSADHVLLRDKAGVGIAIPSGGSDITIRDTWIDNFYNGVMTSNDFVDATAEKVVMQNLEIDCAIDVHIAKLQNRGIEIRDSRPKGITNLFSISQPTIVDNYHGGSTGGSSATFTVGSVSCQMVTPGDIYYCHLHSFASTLQYLEVTMTIGGSPTSFQSSMLAAASGGVNLPYIGPCAYQALGLLTTHYGVVPMTPISYNSGTGVLVARVWPYWLYQGFGTTALTDTDLDTEINAATTLYASTWGSMFVGDGISVRGGHSEMDNTLVTPMAKTGSGGGGHNCELTQFALGYLISQHGAPTPIKELQKVLPYFLNNSSDGVLELNKLRQGDTDTTKVMVDCLGASTSRIIMEKCSSFDGKIIERSISPGNISAEGSILWGNVNSKAFGCVESDRPKHRTITNSNAVGWMRGGWPTSRFYGSRPDYSAIPQISQTLIDRVTNFTGGIGGFPLVFGQRFYQLLSWNDISATNALVKWTHEGITYGKDFDGAGGNFNRIGFTARGGSPFIVLDDDNSGADILAVALEGWVLTLNNGATDNNYICCGFDPDTFTAMVVRASDSTIQGFNGTSGVQYTGNVKQQTFTLENFGAKI